MGGYGDGVRMAPLGRKKIVDFGHTCMNMAQRNATQVPVPQRSPKLYKH